MIGLERSSYYVDENSDSVTVCASVESDDGMEEDVDYSVEMRTTSNGNGRNNIEQASLYCFLSYRVTIWL